MNASRKTRKTASRTCPVCDAEFARADSMRRHLLSQHDPSFSEPDPRRRGRFSEKLRHFVSHQKERADRVMKNPVEVTAPEAGKVRVRSIKPGAPSKEEDDEEIAVEEARVRGPSRGLAAVPTAVPHRRDERKKARPGEIEDEEKPVPDIPAFAPGDILRFGGDDFRVRKDARLEWVVFPKEHGTKLEEGEQFRVGERTYLVVRAKPLNPLLSAFMPLTAREIQPEDRAPASRTTEKGGDEKDDEDHESSEDRSEKHGSGNPWLAPFGL